jgi:hypothetical protein
MLSGSRWVAAVGFLTLVSGSPSFAESPPWDSKEPVVCGSWEGQADAYVKARDRQHNIDATRQIVIENKWGDAYDKIAMRLIDSIYADLTIDRILAQRMAKDSCGWPSTAAGVEAAKVNAIVEINAMLKVANPSAKPYPHPAPAR